MKYNRFINNLRKESYNAMDKDFLYHIYTYIEEHIHEKISLPELAEQAGYSPFYFSKLFSEATGMSITGYVRVRKLQYALSSLLDGMTVLDVSLSYSFDSHEGFTRSFKQLFGSTPSTAKKYLRNYQIPKIYFTENSSERKEALMNTNTTLQNDLNQMVIEVLKNCFKEAADGFCTNIGIMIYSDGKISITDNGRGIRLSGNSVTDQDILNRILAGHPITKLEYSQMGDFSQNELQIVNSLCEYLQVNIYRDNKWFQQTYIRGIAQHEIRCKTCLRESRMELLLTPDKYIFKDLTVSEDALRKWISVNLPSDNLKITINHETFCQI